jgi:hypothetical protein
MSDPIQLPHGFIAIEVSPDENSAGSGSLGASFAIKDRTGAVRAHVSVDDGRIVGIKPMQGTLLEPDAAVAVESYLARLDLPIMCPTDAIGGRIMDSTGGFHDRDALPDELHVRGWLLFHEKEKVRLPARSLTVDGGLYLVGCVVDTFPSDHLKVGDSATFYGSNVAALPKGTSIGTDLSLGQEMTALPDGLSVGRILRMGGSKVSTVPEGTVCGGPVMFDSGQIETLPSSVTDETIVYIFDPTSERTFHTTALWCRHRTEIMEERRVLRERIASRTMFERLKDLAMGRPSPKTLLRRNHQRSTRLSMGLRDAA